MTLFKNWTIKKRILCFIGIGIFTVWSYLVYDINSRFPEPKEYAANLNESVDYGGIKTTLTNISYYEFGELLEKYPVLDNKLKKVYGDDLSENYNENYILAEFTMENNSSETIDLQESGKNINTMTLELLPYSNGSSYFINSAINGNFGHVIESGEKITVYLVFTIHKMYMDMEEMKTYDVKICYEFYPEKKYFYYKPDIYQK